MTLTGMKRRLQGARQRLKDRLYTEFAALIQDDLDEDTQARAFNLVKRLCDLENEDGAGSLERCLNRLPRPFAEALVQALERLADAENRRP